MAIKLAAVVGLAVAAYAQKPAELSKWMERGRAAIGARQIEKAIEAFRNACAAAPNDPDACYFLGRTLQSLDRFEEARLPLDQALANASSADLSRAHRAVALNYIGLTLPEKAEPHFQAAIRHYPEDSAAQEDPRVDYGAFLVRQARASDALPFLEKATKAKPDSARAHAEMGRALLDVGKADEAAKSLERALALNPTAWTHRLVLARAYQQLGRGSDAERELAIAREGWAAQHSGPSRLQNDPRNR